MNSTHSLNLKAINTRPAMIPDNKSTVRNFIEATFNQGDLSQLETFIHPEYHYRSPTEEIIGIDALRAFASALRSAFPDMHVEVREQIGESPKVCTRVVMTGTHQGEFTGIPPTGQPIKIEGTIISQLDEGRITQEWELLDQLSLLQQLGLLPKADAA